MKKAVIIGAGIAGIATAIRLAVQGKQVTVYEKNNYPGGKLSAFEQNGYRFDAGPSLFTQPQLIEELFALAEEPIEDYFSYERVPVSCKYFFEDGTNITAHSDPYQLAEEIEAKLGERKGVVLDYLAHSGKVFNRIGPLFLDRSLHKGSMLFSKKIFNALSALKPAHLFGSLHGFNQKYFTNPKTVQLFDRYATYNGSNPYKAPGMLSMIPHLEHNEGVFYPRGGMISITDALYKLALKKGVTFCFDAPVQRIIRHNSKVTGVVVNDQNIDADIVVSNMDVYFTYHQLLRHANHSMKIQKQERSSSALIFYWGMNGVFDQLGLHDIFFSEDYRAEFDHLFRLKKAYKDPTVYINITSKCEPGLQAPNGKENWFVMVNAPANTDQDWQQYRAHYREVIIAKLNRMLQTDIGPLIETEEILDPTMIETRTSSYQGSLYGTSSNSKLSAFFRHPNFSSVVSGLYFTGGSVHPGGGIPLCLRSAKITSELIAKK